MRGGGGRRRSAAWRRLVPLALAFGCGTPSGVAPSPVPPPRGVAPPPTDLIADEPSGPRPSEPMLPVAAPAAEPSGDPPFADPTMPEALPSEEDPGRAAPPRSERAAGLEHRGALGPLPGAHIPRGPPVARVRAFAPRVEPAEALAADAIARVVHRHRPELGECLERELSASPALSGRLEVRFVIALDGTVPSAELVTSSVGAGGSVSDASGARSCEACVLSSVRSWVFPPPHGGAVTVTQPLSLEASEPMLPSTGEPPDPGAHGALVGVERPGP